jgi:hypothetical protein
MACFNLGARLETIRNGVSFSFLPACNRKGCEISKTTVASVVDNRGQTQLTMKTILGKKIERRLFIRALEVIEVDMRGSAGGRQKGKMLFFWVMDTHSNRRETMDHYYSRILSSNI